MRLAITLTLAAGSLLAATATPTFAQGAAPTTATSKVVERIPERWKAEEGLVVGQLAGTWDFGFATMGGQGIDIALGVKGGGGRVRDGLFRGVVLFTRSEADVTLSGARAEVGGLYQQLNIGRRFETKQGQVTVLGLMYFQKDASTRDGYRMLAFDNSAETIDYLRRTYPQLFAGHESPAVVLAHGDYLPMAKLAELRTAYAQREARAARRQGQFWVAAPAGTIAEVKVVSDSVQVLRFLPPVTYHEPMTNSWDAHGVLTFASSTHRWRVVDGKVEELAPELETGKSASGR